MGEDNTRLSLQLFKILSSVQPSPSLAERAKDISEPSLDGP